MEGWKTMEPHNIRQKRNHYRKVGDMECYRNEPHKNNPIISCEYPPLILHSQTTIHNNICKEQGKDSFYSEFVLQSIIKLVGTLLGMAGR